MAHKTLLFDSVESYQMQIDTDKLPAETNMDDPVAVFNAADELDLINYESPLGLAEYARDIRFDDTEE